MSILQTTRIVTISALSALATFSAGCDTLSSLQHANSNSNNLHDAPGLDPVFPSARTPQTLPKKDPHAFVIGAVLPLTGGYAESGQSMQRGLQLAVEEINASGGINSQPIQLAMLDSKNDPETGATALAAFQDYGEAVLLVGDGPLAVAKAEKLGDYPAVIGFLCDFVAGPKLTPKNGVRIYLNGDQEGRLIENYVEASGIDRVAVIHQNDLLGLSNSQYLLYLFSGNHGIFTTEEGYATGEQSFTLLGQAMMRVNSGALVLAGIGPEYAKLLDAFDTAGWKGLVLAYAGARGLSTVAGPGRLAGTLAYPLPDFAAHPRSTTAGQIFADAYRAKFGADPDLPAAYAYDNICAFAAAAKQTASADPQKLRAAFIALGTYTGAVGRYEIKADGDTEMPLRLLHVDGQPLPPPVKPDSLPTSSDVTNLHAPPLTQP